MTAIDAMRALGTPLSGKDLDCYAEFGKDPNEPILGGGDRDCRVACFGRDPGRDEVRLGAPFVGAGGRKIRSELATRLYPQQRYTDELGLKSGTVVFWANMVPFKPVGNKAWPAKVVTAFRPLILEYLLEEWDGADIITLGEGAFFWFALGNRQETLRLKSFWTQEDRYEQVIEVEIASKQSSRTLRLLPLPHPSPLNATWAPLFPGLLQKRLDALGIIGRTL